ncbi:MAG: SDR family oxidoreductase [Planctomycetaceae bacterium]|nr:SDR family oxidoreductase [Planctomycetaceae bacterium]
MRGQTAWITGASRGIGLACARGFTRHGARVVGFDLEPSDELAAVASETRFVDVADFTRVGVIAHELIRDGFAPDVLVNNAGITRDAVVWKMQEADFDAVIDVSLKGAFNFIRHSIPSMRERGRGSIVNMTSINGLRGKFGQSNYCAAKAGLVGLTKSVAREVGKFGIRVNAVAPGMVETDMTRLLPASVIEAAKNETLLGKLATPDDISNLVLFLASPVAGHITGQVISVDGGQYL